MTQEINKCERKHIHNFRFANVKEKKLKILIPDH